MPRSEAAIARRAEKRNRSVQEQEKLDAEHDAKRLAIFEAACDAEERVQSRKLDKGVHDGLSKQRAKPSIPQREVQEHKDKAGPNLSGTQLEALSKEELISLIQSGTHATKSPSLPAATAT